MKRSGANCLGGGAVPAVPLTARQQRFVEEFLTSLNGTKAAIAAGYR